MKAINLFAGIGTMTRAFLAHGTEIIWAQEEVGTAAKVYRYNFPQIPLYEGAPEEAVEQIPEHDLLLAAIRCTPHTIHTVNAMGNRQAEKESEERIRIQKQPELLCEVVDKYRPLAVCIMLPGMLKAIEPALRYIGSRLSEAGYCYRWALLRGTENGEVPFTGRKGYLAAFREEGMWEKFSFPKADQRFPYTIALPQWNGKRDERCYDVPKWCAELFLREKPEQGKIYSIVSGSRGKLTGSVLKAHDYCPGLTEYSWYSTFVIDEKGIRRIAPEEYMAVQGDRGTRFPPQMSNRKIWGVMRYAGIYGIEEKIAAGMHRALEDVSLQERIAGYLLREFDNRQFLYKKKMGMVCMPTGCGSTQTMQYLVQGILKRTWGKWKVIVLETNRHSCVQMEQVLGNGGLSAKISGALGAIDDFLLGGSDILVVTYMAWANYIRERKPEGIHTNLVLLGAEAEMGWRYLTGTEAYLPQAVYAGVATISDPEAAEVFGPVRYQYTLQQACEDHTMVPTRIDYLHVPQNTEDGKGALAEEIRRDMLPYGKKTLIITSSIAQAQYLQNKLHMLCMEAQENREISLCVSSQQAEDRDLQLRAFRRSGGNILITVNMWRELQIPEIGQIYVLGWAGEQDLLRILDLVSIKCPGKETGRVVIQDREVFERALALTDNREDNEELHRFCTCLWEGEYAAAAADFERIREVYANLAEQIKKELAVLHGQAAAKINEGDREARRRMIRLWLLMSRLSAGWEETLRLREELPDTAEGTADTVPEEKEQAEWICTGDETPVWRNSAEQGAVLENAFLRLLDCLFTWNPEDNPELGEKAEAVLHFLQKRPGGDQNGRDLDLVYLDDTRQKRSCHFECKNVRSQKLKAEAILHKIRQVQRNAKGEIEHWILVMPVGKLEKSAAELFEEAERTPGMYYPVKDIQVWNEESGIRELFGIVPQLYEIFYGGCSGETSKPEDWSAEEKNGIIHKWKQKLMPVLLLPQGLLSYPRQPEKLMFELQNDASVRDQYESLFKYRVKMNYYLDNQQEKRYYSEDEMVRWLSSEECRARVLLGEFASGKTFFLYCLCRKLLEEFVKNPQNNYIPICISLRNLREVNSPSELLERRMKEMGCGLADFYSLKEKFHVLVCLDGFDEITSVIDDGTIEKNIKRLAACCEHLSGTKILVTSRPQCFAKKEIKERLSERLGGLEILHLAPVEQEAGEQFVLFGTGEDRIKRWELISGDRNIRALMEKPFFLDMIRQLLDSGEIIGKNAVSVYGHYIRACLRRKFDSSFDREDSGLLNTGQTIGRIYHALCAMSYMMQEKGEESVRISELEDYLGKPAAEVLWMEENAGKDVRQDADNRFSMRTLLKYAGADSQRVAFSHRSIQEYFVAVYLWGLLENDDACFEEALGRHYFSNEILGFLAELIQGEPSGGAEILRKLAALVERETAQTKLAAKVMQIMYFADQDRKIPEACWSGKDLAGISIPGADLTGQNFRGTVFVNANLNNVRLDDCDCSGCNMTGARLGESGRILALRYEGGELICLYEDGCMRRWDIQHGEEISCVADFPLMERVVLGECGMIYTQNQSRFRLIAARGRSWEISQEYVKRNNRELLAASGELRLFREKSGAGTEIALVHMQDGTIRKEWRTDENGHGVTVDGRIAVIYDGKDTIEVFDVQEGERNGTFTAEKRGSMIALAAHVWDGVVCILTGYRDGTIWAYQYEDGRIHTKMEGRLYGLMHLAFCGNETAVFADSEGAVHRALLHYEQRKIQMDWKPEMKLSISCRNIKTDGLIPENIRVRLEERSQEV